VDVEDLGLATIGGRTCRVLATTGGKQGKGDTGGEDVQLHDVSSGYPEIVGEPDKPAAAHCPTGDSEGEKPAAEFPRPAMDQTLSSRNSRSHELITRKKVSYSLRLTEM